MGVVVLIVELINDMIWYLKYLSSLTPCTEERSSWLSKQVYILWEFFCLAQLHCLLGSPFAPLFANSFHLRRSFSKHTSWVVCKQIWSSGCLWRTYRLGVTTLAPLIESLAEFHGCVTDLGSPLLALLSLAHSGCVEISTRNAFHLVCRQLAFGPLQRNFSLHFLGLLFGFLFSKFLLSFVNAFVSGVHLKVTLQLTQLHWLSVPQRNYIVKWQN